MQGLHSHISIGVVGGKGEQYGTLPLQLLVRQHVCWMGNVRYGTLMSAFGWGRLIPPVMVAQAL